MNIRRAFLAQLPPWARPDHPVLRYVLQQGAHRRVWTRRWIMRLSAASVLLALVTISEIMYDQGLPLAVRRPLPMEFFTVLYFPLILVQFVTLVMAFALGATLLTGEQQRGTWESFKVTAAGAELVIRARWAAVFYQLRWMLALVVVPRLVFTVQALADLTDYQGYHLDLYIMGITPAVPVEAAIFLLAAYLTAALLLPFALVGLNAALGLWMAVNMRGAVGGRLARFGMLIGQVIVFLWALFNGLAIINRHAGVVFVDGLSPLARWLRLLALGVFGDQGLRFLHLESFLQVWVDVPYGVLLGVAWLAIMGGAALLTQFVLDAAARRAARPERE